MSPAIPVCRNGKSARSWSTLETSQGRRYHASGRSGMHGTVPQEKETEVKKDRSKGAEKKRTRQLLCSFTPLLLYFFLFFPIPPTNQLRISAGVCHVSTNSMASVGVHGGWRDRGIGDRRAVA